MRNPFRRKPEPEPAEERVPDLAYLLAIFEQIGEDASTYGEGWFRFTRTPDGLLKPERIDPRKVALMPDVTFAEGARTFPGGVSTIGPN